MATVSAVILKHHKKQDGTWNVKIRISHQGSSSYIDTQLFASRSDCDTKIRLKKVFIDNYLTSTVNDYRKKLNELGPKLEYLTAAEIKEYIVKSDEVIDLFAYGDKYIEQLIQEGRETTYSRRKSNLKKFKLYTGKKTFSPALLTSKMVKEYEAYLFKCGYKSVTVTNNISDLRAIFNKAKAEYNDEEHGIIRIHNSPFSIYKMPKAVVSRKKALDVETLKKIRDAELPMLHDRIARDLFMLSFYLCGTNATDFYSSLIDPNIKRFEYNRNKTKEKRIDSAFISIKVIPEAKPLVKNIAGMIQKRYATTRGLNNRLSETLRNDLMREISGVDGLTFYHARHSFATLARRAGFSRDDVAAALNHKQRMITDDYIDENWDLIDKIQRTVVDLLK